MGRASQPIVLILAGAVVVGILVAGLPVLAAGVGALVLVAVFVAHSLSLDRLAFVVVALFVFTISWNGLRIGAGVALGFLIVAVAIVIFLVIVERRQVPVPLWLAIAAAGLAVSALLVWVDPPSRELINRSYILDIQLAAGYVAPGSPLYEPHNDLIAFLGFELGLILIPVLIATVATSRQRCATLLDCFVASAAISAFVGIVDVAGISIAPVDFIGERSAGLTIHPNYLALNAALALPPAMLWLTRPGKWAIAGAGAVLVLLGGVFASGSRAGTIAALLAVALTVVALPKLRRSLPIVVPVVGTALIALLLFTALGNQFVDQVRLGENDVFDTAGSDQGRANAQQLAEDQIAEEPIHGAGFAFLGRAHDIYFELLATGGIIAMVAFLVFIGGLASCARRAWDSVCRPEVAVCALGIVVWLANGIFNNQLADRYLYVLPGILLALSIAATRSRQASPEHEPEPPDVTEPPPTPRIPAGSAA